MSKENNQTEQKQTQWTDLNLDDRILKAIEKAKFPSPTPIQARTIPLALSGCDILARAKTGSGKTLAASIPIIQRILSNTNEKGVNAIYLVPTKELGEQVYQHFLQITSYCKDVITCYHILGTESPETRKMHLRELPRVVIGTPFQLVKALEANEMDVKKSLQFIVMDEADYLLVDQMSQIQKLKKLYFPPVVQCIMMSATLSKELNEKKSILLTNPKVVALDEKESLGAQGKSLKQYFIK
jgi:ATP-dependent RNA helicase DDX56/DBP9